ncbi:MAG TPA: PQQ-dependent sugar dehydrogenase [Chitinophagaceae bacterium]|nr:PQQ-dependent sugar dehydrogenase [Chitinophagaceae bacterium]
MKQIFPYGFSLSMMLVAAIACGNDASKTSNANKDSAATTQLKKDSTEEDESEKPPVSGDVELKLPNGFTAIEVTPGVGKARHLVVNSNGDIYVKLSNSNGGKSIIVLKDKNGDGVADETRGFADYGGTGIAIKNGYLYASSNNDVYRYKLNANNEVDTNSRQTIVTGLLAGKQHNTKSLALDDAGNIYVTIGAPSNACQVQDRTKGSPGQDPCPLLEKQGGIWQFKANKLNQSYEQGTRYATGIRNVVGLDWNKQSKQLYAMQHGRDQLYDLYPDLFDAHQSAELPAEEMLLVKKGSNFGWPYCYYDQFQSKKVLAPEYGGDGKKQGRCAGVDQPIMTFPGHWAPNALMFYTGKQFPEHYRSGAFICFHGSWNRSPENQAGYLVAFVPFKNGKPSGKYEVFADGFTGLAQIKGAAQAKHRPMGLAIGPDGALYISDSVKGTIWKIVYKGK